MEGRPPFDPDDLDFDFESIRRRRSQGETGERAAVHGAEDEEHPSGEHAEPPSDEAPYDTGESSADTGERYETGERGTGEDPFDTGERRRRREKPRRRFRIGRRRSRDRRADRAPATTDTGEPRLEDDPFTPAVVPVSGSRRSRHRDLPAKVRRRQAGLAGAVAVAGVVAIVVLARAVFGGGGDDDDEPLPVKRLVGQTIIGRMGKAGPDRDLLRRVRKGQIGGVFVVPQDEQTLAAQVAELQQAASDGGGPQLLVLTDQEGGDVKQLPNGPPNLSAPEMGEAGADTARTEGEDTGNFLRGAGVNVDLAPVMDVELPQTADTIASRTFSDDPAVVSDVGSAFIQGLQSTAVAATAKHFPGLGPATVNTDFAPTEIAARQETLDAALQPFQAAVDAGVELVMVASASYPAYGSENPKDPNRPANAVRAIVDNLLRGQLGFQGLVITDNLQSIAIETLTTPSVAGVAALGAGCDLLLYSSSSGGSEDGFAAVVKAVKQGKLSREQVQASYDRIISLKSRLASAASDE